MNPTEPAALQEIGWARYDCARILDGPLNGFDGSLERLRQFFRGLPPDRYAPESRRFRRHTRGVFLPWEDRLSWMPNIEDAQYGGVIDYDMQGFNSEFAQTKRQMPAIPDEIRLDPFIERIVRFDVAETLWLGDFARTPLSVGMGCVLLSVDEAGQEAASTPNILHQDGGAVAFTFVHLVLRDNVEGGINYISPPRCVGMLPWELTETMIDAEFTLNEALDTFAVHNSRVSHYVSPVRRGNANTVGQRGVLIVAVSPLVKKL
jgi:hypothetical protein